MQHSATATDHHPPKPMANGYYQENPSAHSAAGVATSNGMMGTWPGADSQQYQHGCNTTDTACSSPLDTPLAKIMQQQHASSVAGANGVSGGSGAEPVVATAHPTPPQSAASHGFSNAHNHDAWRAYQNPYHQGIPVPGAYSAAAFASPISSGMPTGLDNGTFEHSAATAEYYYANNGHPHQAQHQHPHQHPHQLTHPSSGTMSAHQPNGIADMHQLHYQQSHAQAMGVGPDRDGTGQQQHHSQQQQQHPHHHQQHPGLHHHDPSVSQFEHAAAAAVGVATGNPHYMGDFGHGMYAGAQEIASAPGSVMHLPPIDPASGLSRNNSYFSMAGSPGSNFDPMSAAAVAAAAAAAASAGTYSPHPASQNQYMTAAAARGQQPYPSTMMIGRFNMGGMPSNSAPGAIPTPPPPASAMQAQHPHQPPPLGSSGSSMSVPSTPTRPIGMSRMNSHGQSSTTQRKRYLCTVCQKMFARPSTLSTHMHSHTGEKPYECTWDGCEKRFSVMSNLRRHQRIHERQRQKYANVQQQHNQMQPADTSAMASGDESSDESTTPLASQIHAVAPHAHHHRHPHHMSPPPAFNQPPMLASHAQGGMSAPLGMHHHGLPALHHPHQPHQQLQQHPHHHPHHMMAPVASQQHYQHQHYQHQQPQVSMPDTLTKHSVGPNSIHDDSATVMSANEEPVPMLNGASTTSTNTINPTTPQSSGLKE